MSAPQFAYPERSALAADVLRASGRLRLRVHGESMLPTLWPHQVVEIAKCSLEDVTCGEIVLALRDGRFYLHRFLRPYADGFVLQGDSMPGPDPPFREGALLGRMVSSSARVWSEGKFLCQLRRTFGRILCYWEPARRLALHLHARAKKRRPAENAAAMYRELSIDLTA